VGGEVVSRKKEWWQDSFISEEEALAVAEVLEPPGRLQAMEDASRRLGRPQAASRVADLLEGGV